MEMDKYGQGFATEIESGSEEESKDISGFTNPNLHRRIVTPDMSNGVSYQVGLFGLNSYRISTYTVHDEDSDDSEIP